jgi:hypothetical protein
VRWGARRKRSKSVRPADENRERGVAEYDAPETAMRFVIKMQDCFVQMTPPEPLGGLRSLYAAAGVSREVKMRDCIRKFLEDSFQY